MMARLFTVCFLLLLLPTAQGQTLLDRPHFLDGNGCPSDPLAWDYDFDPAAITMTMDEMAVTLASPQAKSCHFYLEIATPSDYRVGVRLLPARLANFNQAPQAQIALRLQDGNARTEVVANRSLLPESRVLWSECGENNRIIVNMQAQAWFTLLEPLRIAYRLERCTPTNSL